MKRKMKLCQFWNGSFSLSSCARLFVVASKLEHISLTMRPSWLWTLLVRAFLRTQVEEAERDRLKRSQIALDHNSSISTRGWTMKNSNLTDDNAKCFFAPCTPSSGLLQFVRRRQFHFFCCMLKRAMKKREIRQWKVSNDITTCFANWMECARVFHVAGQSLALTTIERPTEIRSSWDSTMSMPTYIYFSEKISTCHRA